MTKVLSETELRAKCLGSDVRELCVSDDVFVTPGAKEYLRERGIELKITSRKSMSGGDIMPFSATTETDSGKHYTNALTGETYSYKPENMTHLYANVLVPKNHPRIVFRGKLDSLSAEIIKVQSIAEELGYKKTVDELAQTLDFTYGILSAEVNELPVEEIKLLGYDSEGLRYATHHMTETFGFQHTLPHYKNGRLCAELNRLRTLVREAEISAVQCFDNDGVCTRSDIIEALNRLSSCVYIIYCRVLTEKIAER